MLDKRGSQFGRNLNAQKLTVNRDLDLASTLGRARRLKGSDLSTKETEAIKKSIEMHQASEQAVAATQVKLNTETATAAIQATKNKKTKVQAVQDADKAAAALLELLQKGC